MSGHSVYLYAVGDAGLAEDPELGGLSGVDDAPVRAVVDGALAAVVASVDRDRYSEQALYEGLEDLDWLSRLARGHHHVVDALSGAYPVAPVRMATVYLDDERVRAMLRDHAADLGAALDRVRGRAEWGVKAYAAPVTGQPAQEAGMAASAGPGTAYLLRRKAERTRVADQRAAAAAAAERVHDDLAGVAVASRLYPPQDPRLTGVKDEMVLNAAYLTDEDGAEQLRRLLDRHSDGPLRLELTGPWAPYSFTVLGERT
jgi:hypothetical protein